MASSPTIQLNIKISEANSTLEERNRECLRLIHELKQNPDIEDVNLIPCQQSPAMSKGIVSFITGVLTAEINPKNIKSVLYSLYTRLAKNSIELEVATKERRLKVTARSREDLEIAIKSAQDFISTEVSK